MYEVENSAGGTAYHGSSLKLAMEYAVSGGWAGYVISKKGRRPVIRDDYGRLIVGKFGETVREFRRRTDEEDA